MPLDRVIVRLGRDDGLAIAEHWGMNLSRRRPSVSDLLE
jgi:hypothetical protein